MGRPRLRRGTSLTTPACRVVGCPTRCSEGPVLHSTALGTAAVDSVYVGLLINDGGLDRFLAALQPHGWARVLILGR